MFIRNMFILSIVALLLSGCGSAAQPETAAPTATPPPTNTATPAPTDTPQPTATHTPPPTLTPTPTPTPVPAGSEAISPENAARLELLDWPVYGGVAYAFYPMDGEEKLASVLQTNTHLVGYSLEGEYLYELPAPQTGFFFFGPEPPSKFPGNHRYTAIPSPDESYTVDIYDLATGERAHQLDHLVNFPQARFQQNEWADTSANVITFNQDGSLLAVAYADNSISIWDLVTGVEHSLPRTFQDALGIAFSSGNEMLAVSAGYWNTNLTLFDISDLDSIELLLAQNEVGHLVSDPFSRDNRYLLTAETGGNAKYAYFDLEKMEMVERAGIPTGTYPAFSEDGSLIIFQANWWVEGAEMSALNLETREMIRDQELIRNYLPDAEESWWTELHQMNYPQSNFYAPRIIRPYKNTFTGWNDLQYYSSPNGDDGSYQLNYWLAGEGGIALDVSLEDLPEDEYVSLIGKFGQSEEEIFYCLETQLFGKTIAAAGDPEVLAENCVAPGIVAFDPGHNAAAYPVSKNVVAVINVNSRETLFTLSGYTRDLAEIQFSPDGSVLALKAEPNLDRPGSFDFSELMLFSLDYQTGRSEAVPLDIRSKVFEDYVMQVAVTGDGSYLAAGVGTQDADKNPPKIYLWDFEGLGAQRRTIYTWAGSMSFSPDKSILAVASGESFQLYSVTTSELLSEYTPPTGQSISQLLFSADGKSIFVLIDGAVSIWGVP